MGYTVEMMIAQNVTIEGIEARDESEAIEIAKKKFKEDKYEYVDVNELQVDTITFVSEEE